MVILALALVIGLVTQVGGVGNTKTSTDGIEKLIRLALEDHSWLSLKTKKEMRAYCESIYSDELVDSMTAALLDFVAYNEDWHTEVKVKDIEINQSNFEKIVATVDLEYSDLVFGGEGKPSYKASKQETILVSVIRQPEGYRISGINYPGEIELK